MKSETRKSQDVYRITVRRRDNELADWYFDLPTQREAALKVIPKEKGTLVGEDVIHKDEVPADDFISDSSELKNWLRGED